VHAKGALLKSLRASRVKDYLVDCSVSGRHGWADVCSVLSQSLPLHGPWGPWKLGPDVA
jgi:hypothetical protein